MSKNPGFWSLCAGTVSVTKGKVLTVLTLL